MGFGNKFPKHRNECIIPPMRSVVICPECRREFSFETLTCPVCKSPTVTVLRKPCEKPIVDTAARSGSHIITSADEPEDAVGDRFFPIRSPMAPTLPQRKEYSFHSTIALSKLFIVLQILLILGLVFSLALVVLYISIGGNSFAKIEEMVRNLQESPAGCIYISNPINILNLITNTLFLFWVYYSNVNLWALQIKGIEYSPGWAVGYFFIPIFNFVKPYSIVKEIWRLSCTGSTEGGLVHIRRGNLLAGFWWGTFLLAFLLYQPFALPFPDYEGTSAAATFWLFVCFILSILFSIVSWILGIVIVRSISRKQQGLKAL